MVSVSLRRPSRAGVCLVAALALQVLPGCAATSTLTVPRCAERVEIAGQHARHGRTLVFDHSFDPPWAVTEVVLERDGERVEALQIPHTRPDPGRLFAGILTTALGAVVTTAALQELQQGATLEEEGPFYGVVFGGTAVGIGALLSLTGWAPQPTTAVSSLCGEAD